MDLCEFRARRSGIRKRENRGVTNIEMIDRIPTDVWFEIAILCGNYKNDYCAIAEVVPSLNCEERRSQARAKLTVCRKKYSGHRVVEEHYSLDGVPHREGDLPADIENTVDKCIHRYIKFGLMHREGDLPAYTEISSDRYVYQYKKQGKLHRDNDLPACISPEVDIWYKNGERHRDNNLPAFVYKINDRKYWYYEGIEYNPFANWSFGIAMGISVFIVGAFVGDVISKNYA